MQTKLFELRDAATFIPVIATRMQSDHDQEHYLLQRAGYSVYEPYLVLLTRLDGGEAHYDQHQWPVIVRTFRVAHTFIADNWDDLETGAVIDVEHILGEQANAKTSERFDSVGLTKRRNADAKVTN